MIDSKLIGAKEMEDLLSEIAPRHAKNIMRATVHGVAGEIRDDAREYAPTDGPPVVLKKAIKAKREKGAPGYIESTVRVERGPKRDAFFWRFLEYGTTKITAIGFFARAVEKYQSSREEATLRQFVNKFEAALNRANARREKMNGR